MEPGKEPVPAGLKYSFEIFKKLGLPTLASHFTLTGRPLLAALCFTIPGVLDSIDATTQSSLNGFAQLLEDGNIEPGDLRTEDFRAGLERTYDAWMNVRTEAKRKIIRRIFLGFMDSKDRENFRFERMYRALDSLEPDDIIALSRLNKLFLTEQKKTHLDEYTKDQKRHEAEGKTFEMYLEEQTRPGLGFQLNLANQIVNGLIEGMDNLERLGIIKRKQSSANFSGGQVSETFWLTPFGFQFCGFIEDAEAK